MSKDSKPYIDHNTTTEEKYQQMKKKYNTLLAEKESELLKLDNEIQALTDKKDFIQKNIKIREELLGTEEKK